MPAIAATDLARMRDALLFDGPDRARKLSRFWALLLLAAVIATAGVVTDSTATVIGAMIVAPLMTPILGMVLSTVTVDPRNLGVSFLLVATGACAVIALGWLPGQLTPVPVVAATNSQVAGRVDPTLGDLIAALATGAVGSFALVRDDVSDTLPGVAIAISLVPPLAVVGLTLESGAPKQALGALLLFLTNFGAILLTGLIAMAIYRVRAIAVQRLGSRHGHPRLAVAVVVAFVIVLAAPLAVDSAQITSQQLTNSNVSTVANNWANKIGWQIVNVSTTESGVTVRAIGPLPLPNRQTLRMALNSNGLRSTSVQLESTRSTASTSPAAEALKADAVFAVTPTERVAHPSLAWTRVTRTRMIAEGYGRVSRRGRWLASGRLTDVVSCARKRRPIWMHDARLSPETLLQPAPAIRARFDAPRPRPGRFAGRNDR